MLADINESIELSRHSRNLRHVIAFPDRTAPARDRGSRLTAVRWRPSARRVRSRMPRHANAGITSLTNSSSERFCSFIPRPRLAEYVKWSTPSAS